MTNRSFTIISSAALCCIISAALPSKAGAIKILSRPNYNSSNAEPINSPAQDHSPAASSSNSASGYSNGNNNSSTNNANDETPFSQTKHLTVKEVNSFAKNIGSGLACLSDDEDKAVIRKYQDIVRAVMINKTKSKEELESSIQHFTKNVRKAHHAQSSKGISGCGKTMDKIKSNLLMRTVVKKNGDLIMPDGVELIFDPKKVTDFISK